MLYINAYKLIINYCYLIKLTVKTLQSHHIRTIDHHHLMKRRKIIFFLILTLYIYRKKKNVTLK